MRSVVARRGDGLWDGVVCSPRRPPPGEGRGANTRRFIEELDGEPFLEGNIARSPGSLILDCVSSHPDLALHFSYADRCTFPMPLAADSSVRRHARNGSSDGEQCITLRLSHLKLRFGISKTCADTDLIQCRTGEREAVTFLRSPMRLGSRPAPGSNPVVS